MAASMEDRHERQPNRNDIEVQDDGADQILRVGGILVARLTGLEGQRQVDWQPTAHFDDATKTAFAKAYAQSGQSERDVLRSGTQRGALVCQASLET